jgi:hypothetical protein
MADDGYERLLREARADPAVLAVVLTGSHALGLATSHSDHDARVILRDKASVADRARYGEESFPGVDCHVMTLAEFTAYAEWDSPTAWDRYSFAHARIPVDKTGEIAPLVAAKGGIPSEHRRAFVRGTLDAFINSVYRSLKCSRRGNAVCARLEAADAVRHGLAVIFAQEGRVSPYPVYLEYELRHHPLPAAPLAPDALLELIARIVVPGDTAALQQLFTTILGQMDSAEHGDVVAAWGDDIAWMATYQPI